MKELFKKLQDLGTTPTENGNIKLPDPVEVLSVAFNTFDNGSSVLEITALIDCEGFIDTHVFKISSSRRDGDTWVNDEESIAKADELVNNVFADYSTFEELVDNYATLNETPPSLDVYVNEGGYASLIDSKYEGFKEYAKFAKSYANKQKVVVTDIIANDKTGVIVEFDHKDGQMAKQYRFQMFVNTKKAYYPSSDAKNRAQLALLNHFGVINPDVLFKDLKEDLNMSFKTDTNPTFKNPFISQDTIEYDNDVVNALRDEWLDYLDSSDAEGKVAEIEASKKYLESGKGVYNG